ncbi:MAG: PqiC family protein [Desulfovibrio sp.]|jgi:uncharacterized lipoprotein YmbA|nr:PqiC family protein [Desulfovibrio sp.]
MLKSVCPFLLLLSLAACGRSVPDTCYLLESAVPPLVVDQLPACSLRIARVSLPEYLDRRGIVSRSDGQGRLEIAQFHVWAEPLDQNVRRVVQEGLMPLLLSKGITVQSTGDETAGDFTLLLDVRRLDGAVGGMAVLQMQWTFKNKRDDILGRGMYADEEPVSGNDHGALVFAQSRLVRHMTEHLAKVLVPLLEKERV